MGGWEGGSKVDKALSQTQKYETTIFSLHCVHRNHPNLDRQCAQVPTIIGF